MSCKNSKASTAKHNNNFTKTAGIGIFTCKEYGVQILMMKTSERYKLV